jgi:hypothetical protein
MAIISIGIVKGGQLALGGAWLNKAYFASRASRQATVIVEQLITNGYWRSRDLGGLAAAQVTGS